MILATSSIHLAPGSLNGRPAIAATYRAQSDVFALIRTCSRRPHVRAASMVDGHVHATIEACGIRYRITLHR